MQFKNLAMAVVALSPLSLASPLYVEVDIASNPKALSQESTPRRPTPGSKSRPGHIELHLFSEARNSMGLGGVRGSQDTLLITRSTLSQLWRLNIS
ncbi:hypothetical protein BKA61DRAFT_594502 [Leptodontidium sp. MPI-SDFR-AT-0119]|nr:hypothetical protein BKA61DRAFT_594502 [Leptodontidium sp. MPI-SDFR-AT-0119]